MFLRCGKSSLFPIEYAVKMFFLLRWGKKKNWFKSYIYVYDAGLKMCLEHENEF